MKKQVSEGADRPQACECRGDDSERGNVPLCLRTRSGSRGCRTSRISTSPKRTRCVPIAWRSEFQPGDAFSHLCVKNCPLFPVARAAAERAEQHAAVGVRAAGWQPAAPAGDEEAAAGEGADHQGSEGAGWHSHSRPQPDYAEERKWAGGSALIQDFLDLLHALRLCVCADIMIL